MGHLQCRCCNTAGIGCLARQEQNSVFLQVCGGIFGSGHIRPLHNGNDTICHQQFCIFQRQFVLGGTGQRYIDLGAPQALSGMVLCLRTALLVLRQAGPLYLFDLLEQRNIDSLRIVDPAVGIGSSYHLGTQLLGFLNGVSSHVAGTGHRNCFACQRMAMAAEHLLCDIQQTEAGGLSSGQRTAEGQALTGQNALKQAPDTLVLAVHIADLPSAGANVAGGHVRIRTDVTVKFCHKALAESHDLPVGLALGVKIRAALTAADRQTGQGILKNLLKSEEFDNTQIHRGVQTDAALIGADRTAELDTVTGIHMGLIMVIHPGYPEFDLTFRIDQPLQNRVPAIPFFVGIHHRTQRFQNLFDSLVKLRFRRIFSYDTRNDFIHIGHDVSSLQ